MSKKQAVKSSVDLNTLCGGAFAEKVNEALVQVGENIQNMNTDATKKRKITITLTFAPNKTRQLVSTQIGVTTTLAATEAIDTQMIMGVNMRTGQLEIAEYDGQIRGQMSLDDLAESKEDEPQETQEPEKPAGKPLDLRNRNKAQDEDFDPETGENLTGKVVPMGKTAQA